MLLLIQLFVGLSFFMILLYLEFLNKKKTWEKGKVRKLMHLQNARGWKITQFSYI